MTQREKDHLIKLWQDCPANYPDKLHKMMWTFGNHFTLGQIQKFYQRQPFYKDYVKPFKRKEYIIVIYDKDGLPAFTCDRITDAAEWLGVTYKGLQKRFNGSGRTKSGFEVKRIYV